MRLLAALREVVAELSVPLVKLLYRVPESRQLSRPAIWSDERENVRTAIKALREGK